MAKITVADIGHEISPLLARHHVAFAGVFGSMARGEAGEASDVDLLVRFSTSKTLFQAVALQRELSEALKRCVDLVIEASLHPLLRQRVFHDLKFFYGES